MGGKDMRRKTFYCFAMLLFIGSALFSAPKQKGGSIHQIIETRHGKTSCWGVIIALDRLTFKQKIDNDEISIIEAKHSRDLKDIMTWNVDKTRKKLVITFKKGTGDFGSGNIVTVAIQSSAFVSDEIQTYSWTISTDPL
jgi:hypothetical protein